MATPLIELRGVCRDYPSGDEVLTVLKSIDLTIEAGEMVAIVGTSGSGKSTLMNIIGCLDRPSRGVYRVNGQETGQLAPDELAFLRREHFGFIFQRYHLLGNLNALANVEIPAIYAGMNSRDRLARAAALLTRLNMADRMEHVPGKLSGGQQQRVSIARALMNGGAVILADEPTGALDTASGNEVMTILKELNDDGHTIILVTHDLQVAQHANRIIELSDGAIVADRRIRTDSNKGAHSPKAAGESSRWRAQWDRFAEAFHMATLAMASHRLRTLLTMLGIIIGIASVVSVVALGEGSRQRILKDISAMGTNTISIYPGKDFGDMRSGRVRTLIPRDADALAQQPYVDTVTPVVTKSVTLIHRSVSVTAQVNGVGEHYFRVRGMELAEGQLFDRASVRASAQDVVIDQNTRRALFADTPNEVLGQVIMLGKVPCRVIGVTKKMDSNFGDTDTLNLWVPYTTAMHRLTGQQYLRSITVRVADSVSSAVAEQSVVKLLTQRHGTKDFFVSNLDSIRQTIEKTTQTMTLLISSIALISLLVGGIGVMNIMLVSVTERTQEIGVRMAVGARHSDIMQQFLIEAVLVCLLGGFLGIGLALGLGVAVTFSGSDFKLIYSTSAIVSAFLCSTFIGVLFGFLPARNAARLDPVVALSRE
ncbi:ABC transporter related protein [Desulfobulbus propionicus DSM 2032]|uniref:Pyoverdine export ATP-binding/permease protein PvdT n=1 Tax=Desulfobulbus propionicus (strain ATCC 33891 / DSM 2032 / VKM B-1956 / 1pr3) TaxID=577650 RepID=A0A7U3YLW7_DESPD|nr:MacB family efflux pump subunit [Desulfobulbus propionicus]ADW17804.1 ABC transporter related protein [Desulfobulbus propionicus DSM 2032]